MNPITYTSDQPNDYARELSACEDKDQLLRMLDGYKDIAPDALETALDMDAGDFLRFKRGLAKERKGKFAGEEWAMQFGALTMPEIMFKVSMMAQQYGVPWGLMYLRLKDFGKLPKYRPKQLPREGDSQ